MPLMLNDEAPLQKGNKLLAPLFALHENSGCEEGTSGLQRQA